jgi:hypothetical protein
MCSPCILDISTSWRRVIGFTPQPLSPRGKILRYPLDRMLHGPENRSGLRREDVIHVVPRLELRPLGRPARSHSLYRLCYRAFSRGSTCTKPRPFSSKILSSSSFVSHLTIRYYVIQMLISSLTNQEKEFSSPAFRLYRFVSPVCGRFGFTSAIVLRRHYRILRFTASGEEKNILRQGFKNNFISIILFILESQSGILLSFKINNRS